MVWTIVSKAEMGGYAIPPVFQYYREVVGKENIKLAVVEEDDPLDFVGQDDIVLLRTADERLITTIKNKGVRTTAEDFAVYQAARDKKNLSEYLQKCGVQVPKQYSMSSVKDGKTYFVKPRYGGESFGITPSCICKTRDEVYEQVERIRRELNEEAVIEEFIEGVDCTTACYMRPADNRIMTFSIMVECDEVGGIQTHQGKFNYNEYCSAMKGDDKEWAGFVSRRVCELLGIKHHARIDYRLSKNGMLYLIDVNLLPGLGPSAHFSKSLLLTENLSYADTIRRILNSASK